MKRHDRARVADKTTLRASLPTWRPRIVLACVAIAFAGLAARAVYLQGMNDRFLQAKGEARYSRVLEVPATRGRIVDRNGELLAVSTPVRSVRIVPSAFEPGGADLAKLAKLVDLPLRELKRRASETDRDMVLLNPWVPPEAAEQVAAMKIPGILLDRAYRRYYPGGEVMAHVLGFTNVDDVGQEGIELAFQETLAGKPGSRRVIRDRRGQIIDDAQALRSARDGRDVTLALDSRIQNLAHRALRETVAAHKAKGGGVVVIDSLTGEILALANLPAYNPNNRAKYVADQARNRALTDAFEPGSTLKPFTVALALEQGKIGIDTVIQTAPGSLTIGPNTIRDAKAAGPLTVTQVIQKSSNVGTAKIALGYLAPQEMWTLFDHLGFGRAPKLGFPGETSGRVRPYKTWKPIEQATMSYGHGISLSLVHLARAYTLFTRDGNVVPLSLVKLDTPPAGEQIVSAKTARHLRDMMELAVSPAGTAPRAQVVGYRVGGKTGTAHKLEPAGGYARDRYISSFVGFAPASKPRLIVAVMIDEPSNGQYYGGAVAAPAFASVMGGALRMLAVPYDAPLQPITLPPAGEEVPESM